jgi:AAA+ ATPase superfamily predicted ATPase
MKTKITSLATNNTHEFINREKELESLASTRTVSALSSKMTVGVRRRRIGKPRLILESLKGQTCFYFFVARKEEKLLCEEYVEQIREVLKINVFGEISRFKDVFGFLMNWAENNQLNLVIDEFQEFSRINPAVYSEKRSAKRHRRLPQPAGERLPDHPKSSTHIC